MSLIDPLPFRLRVPGIDKIDLQGIRSISYRVEGLLHVDGHTVVLEWAGTRKTEWVALGSVTDEVDRSPVARREVPVSAIIKVQLRGGWIAPRLELRARNLDVFDGIPGARPGVIRLKIRRRDRKQAAVVAAVLDRARRLPESGDVDPMIPPSV